MRLIDNSTEKLSKRLLQEFRHLALYYQLLILCGLILSAFLFQFANGPFRTGWMHIAGILLAFGILAACAWVYFVEYRRPAHRQVLHE